MQSEDRKALIDMLNTCQLPIALPAELRDPLLVDCMLREKRNRGRDISLILPYTPGKALADWPICNVLLSRDQLWAELADYRMQVA